MSKWKDSPHTLGGVKYWAQWMPMGRKPAFELFVYRGSSPEIGQHYFAHFHNPNLMICKNFYQITNDFSFRPFVLDFAKINQFSKESGLP